MAVVSFCFERNRKGRIFMPQNVGRHKDETEDEGRSLWSKCFGLYMCYFGVYTRRGVRKGGVLES